MTPAPYVIPPKEYAVCQQLLSMFQIDGVPADQCAAPGQYEIFHAIIFKPSNRIEILCSTQYGKSLFVALACIILTCIQGEEVTIVAPKDDKAKIIMRYYINHLGDNILFHSQLEKNTRLERLRMEESQKRIVLRNHGSMKIISAQTHNTSKGIEAAMGEGSKNVIMDEAGLIPDIIEATIFRMIAGKKDAFYCKLGNPFERNHFHASWLDPRYIKVFIDYNQALAEGRYTQEFIDEAKKKPFFSVLFACVFPPENMIDKEGYYKLLTDDEIAAAIVMPGVVASFGEKRLAADVAEGGGDWNALVKRSANLAEVLLKYQCEDTMDVAAKIVSFETEEKIIDQNVFIDAIGVGKGVFDRLREVKMSVSEYKSSHEPDDKIQFANKRAECFWRLREWIQKGGKLLYHEDWWQLRNIKYKPNLQEQLLIMSKEDMRKRQIPSPDVVDALSMTFARAAVLNPKAKEDHELLKQFDSRKKKQGIFTGARRR